MKIKMFKARTFADALKMVKRELGSEAVILSSEEKKGLRPYVEVTAAVDYDDSGFGKVFEEEFKRENPPSPTLPGQPADLNDIKKEIERIKESLKEIRFSGFEINLNEKKKKIFHFLRSRGVKEEFAFMVCDKAKKLEEIFEIIKADISTRMDKKGYHFNLSSPRAIMIVGPTGVGKTTTIAKLTAKAIREKKRAGIINLDTYRIGAPEQIRTYARLLGIPLHMASNGEELKEGLRRFSRDRELVFIDTTGRNPRDEGYLNKLLSIRSDVWEDREISERFPLEIHLLMNTNSDIDFTIESYRYYRLLPLDYIALTKTDEAVRFGNIYNMIMTYERPIAYLTTGQKVPDDIAFPEQDEIARLIIQGQGIGGN